jgi:hypothetical protein
VFGEWLDNLRRHVCRADLVEDHASSGFGAARHHKSRIREFPDATTLQYTAAPVRARDVVVRVPLTLRRNADLLAAARVEAQRDSRTLTNLVDFVLQQHLRRIGAAAVGPAVGEPALAAANVVAVVAESIRDDLR